MKSPDFADLVNASTIRRAALDMMAQGNRADALDMLKSHGMRADLGPAARASAQAMYIELIGE